MATIVILGSAYPLRGGGLATFNERLARALQDEGHQVIIYTFSLQYPAIFFPGKTQLANEPAPRDLHIRVKVNSINPLNWWRVGREIRKMQPDMLVIRYWLPFMAPCLGTIAGLVRKNKKTRVVTIADNIIPHESRPGDKFLTRYFVKRSDGFVTLSRSVLKDLLQFERRGKPKVFTPHPLYDNFGSPLERQQALKHLELSESYRYLLFFGFIRDYKGLDILLKAMADPRIKDLPLRLIVAGEFYTNDSYYMQIIQENALADKVILHTRFIPNEKVADYFCACDLVVQPYRDATQSGVTQVAYHFEVPMLVTNVGALPEMVPHGVAGYVVEPDSQQVANAIVDFYSQNKQIVFQEGVRAQKKRFQWENLTKALFEAASLKP